VIQNASLPGQRQALTTLGELSGTVAREDMHSPAVIVVGDVVRGVQHLTDRHSADRDTRATGEHASQEDSALGVRRKR
jgi:uroporphyrin-III C-methyltransferase